MSDKQKGLEQAIKELFSDAAHMHCVRHLHNNFKSDGHQGLELKDKLWAIARSCTMNQFRDALEDMKKSSTTVRVSTKASYQLGRSPYLVVNLEDIRAATMVRLANRGQSGPNWRCNVGPRIEKQLKKNAELSHEYRVINSSNNIFEIQGRGVACASGVVAAHSVSLEARTCTCKRWDISGVPCGHAVVAIHSKGLRPDDFVHDYFTKNTYMKAYDPVMFPISGVAEWDKIHRPIAPPFYRRQPGRPKMSRNKEQGENVVQQQANEGEQQQDPQEAEPVQQ
ncbi:uncharacterized protein LOC112199237 [Rosa chinensis]|uniref:uncharacterized protein LOC112199237 n=1 Tax=Rosa chinensis TaxID=74649 RepID=UPI000D096DFC|nr:uncharacterized protein LOC112199237 [Rosa chinensis]